MYKYVSEIQPKLIYQYICTDLQWIFLIQIHWEVKFYLSSDMNILLEENSVAISLTPVVHKESGDEEETPEVMELEIFSLPCPSKGYTTLVSSKNRFYFLFLKYCLYIRK